MIDTSQIIDILKNDYSKEIIVAFSSGVLIFVAQLLYKYIKNTMVYKKYRGYIGNYYTYTVSTKKSRTISCYEYRVKFRFGKLIYISKNKGLKYTGEVLVTDKNIYLYGGGIEHDEYTQMIFHKPLNNKLTTSVGIFSGVSVLNEPTSKLILIMNEKIDTTEAERILKNYKYIDEELLSIVPISESFYTNKI
jgi:hypothetical protein